MADFNLNTLIEGIGGALGTGHPMREGVAQGYGLWFEKATGQQPVYKRYEDHTYIDWKPGQAQKMGDYFTALVLPGESEIETAPDKSGFSMSEVKVNWGAVFNPLLIRKVLPAVMAYSLIMVWMGRQSTRYIKRKGLL